MQVKQNINFHCRKVGLGLNGPKTKSLAYNIDSPPPLQTRDGTVLEYAKDFKYLGSRVDSSSNDIGVRKAQAWKALNGMTRIWTSRVKPELKKRFFLSTVETILLYGCESWSMTEAQEKTLNGTYTRMLRKALNVH